MLLMLLMCHASLTPKHRVISQRGWGTMLGLALLGTCPLMMAQIVLAYVSLIMAERGWNSDQDSLPGRFFGVFYMGSAEQCFNDSERCVVCVFPAAMIIVMGIFEMGFLAVLWKVSSRVASTAVNRKLVVRLRMFEVGMMILMPASLAFLGTSVSTTPFNVAWQILVALYSCCTFLTVILSSWMLVVVPVYVARSADAVPMTWEDRDDAGQPLVEVLTPGASQELVTLVQEEQLASN